MEIYLNEEGMKNVIKEFLCLGDKDYWDYHTMSGNCKVQFNGNIGNVRMEILNWLSTPERIQQTEAISND